MSRSRSPGGIDVSIVTSGHDVADARLHREVAALHRAGLLVEVLGLGDAADGPAGAARVRTVPRGGPAGRLRQALVRPWQAQGRALMALDPDIAAGAWAASRLRRRRMRRRLVVDVHEDYAALLRDRAWARGWRGGAARGLVRAANAVARRADLTVVADEHVPPLTTRHRRIVLRNLPDAALLPAPGPPDPAPRAVYIGDVRASRGLFAMCEAIAAAPGWSLDVVGPVDAQDASALEQRLRRPDLAGRVRMHGRRPPAASWSLAAGAWVGLCLLEDTPAFRDAVPSKLYEYLAAGLAVICTDLPRPAAIVQGSGAGYVVPAAAPAAGPRCAKATATATATAQVLTALTADPAQLAARRAAAADWSAGEDAGGGYASFASAVAGVLADGPPAD